jgi:Zn-dependent peptidase ImmA (M78 family)/transcriptional regulator with XRE-family HTH domain
MFTTVKEFAGLTQTAIAQHAGVSQATVSKIENGFETPSPELLESVAGLAGVPVGLFGAGGSLISESVYDIFHKKRLTLPQKPLKRANASARITRVQVSRLLRAFDEVPATIPMPSLPIDEYESAEEIAGLTRATWQTPAGPIANLVDVVEATGTPVLLRDLGHEKLRAMSMPSGLTDGSQIIIINKRLPASAQRFALAHEIGHLVMHQGTGSEAMEREADMFASALLMPAADIRPKLRNLKFNNLGMLKRYWLVSMASLIYRAHALGVISERQYKSLNVQLNRLPNGRKREPGEFPVETPSLVKRAIEYYLNNEYTMEQVCELALVTEESLRSDFLDEPVRPRGLRLVRT